MRPQRHGRSKYNSENFAKVSSGKLPEVAYLYGDGTVLFIFRKTVKGTRIEWAEVHQNYVNSVFVYTSEPGVSTSQTFRLDAMKGRTIFRDYGGLAMLRLAKGGDIEIHAPSVGSGSENTRNKNIRVGTLHVYSRDGELYVNQEMPGLISGIYETQYVPTDFERDPSRYGSSWEALRKSAADNGNRVYGETSVQRWVERQVAA
jgi:hypothetical protein